MFKRRGVILVVMSLIMGVGAAWAANNWVRNQLGLVEQTDVPSDAIMVAALEIPYGTKVESRHIKPLLLPEGTAPDRAVREATQVEGMVATADIARGEILLQDRFASHETGSTLAALVQKDQRAVTLRVDDVVGVAGFLLPGNRVDVLATRLDRNTQRATTDTILTNLKVLAVDQTASTDKNEPVIVRAVTLEMSPDQSEDLVKAKEEGKIQLTLRNPLAQDPVVVQEASPPVARPVVRPQPPRAPAPKTITVIRGTEASETKSPG